MAKRYCMFLIVLIFCESATAQKKWDVDFSLTGRKELLISENAGKAFDNYYKFTSSLTFNGEVLCSYRVSDCMAIQTGIGIGSTNNGVGFSIDKSEFNAMEKVGIDFMYLRFPITMRYTLTPRFYFKIGLAFHVFTDYQRTYSSSFSSSQSLYFDYKINTPFVDDFTNTSCDLSLGYNFSKRFGIITTGGFYFSNKYPRTSMDVTIGTDGNLYSYSYEGKSNTFYLGLGLTFHLFSFGNSIKTQSVYKCPEG